MDARLHATENPPKEYARLVGSTFSLRVIAAAIILLFAYYAQGVVITLVLSILLAYCLDPVVEFLERWHIPRTIGSMVMVLLLCTVIAAVGYGLWSRASDFAESWPKYSGVLRHAANSVEAKISGIERGVDGTSPPQNTQTRPPFEPPRDTGIVRNLIIRSIGSLYALFLEVTFVPFLVFFMLAGKREAWHGTLQLFPAARCSSRLCVVDECRHFDGDHVQQPVFLGTGPGLSDSARNRLRHFEYAAVHRSGPRLAACIHAGAHQMANHWLVFTDRWRADGYPYIRVKFDRATVGREAAAVKRRCNHCLTALLGMGLGRYGPAAGHSDHGYAASAVRSYRRLKTNRALAQRVITLPRGTDRPIAVNSRREIPRFARNDERICERRGWLKRCTSQ